MGNSTSNNKIIESKVKMAEKTGVLNLSNLKASQLNAALTNLIESQNHLKVRSLDISGVDLKTLPKEIIQFCNIRTLIASRCSLNQLTQSPWADLTKLQQLDLSHNSLDIDSIPTFHSTLHKLDLSHNNLSAIPVSLHGLMSLNELDLSYNRIETLIGVNQLPSLVTLNLDHNQIPEVLDEISQLTKLKRISLRNNNIKQKAVSREGQSITPLLFINTPVEFIDLNGNELFNADVSKFVGVESYLERRKQIKEKAFQGGAIVDSSDFNLNF